MTNSLENCIAQGIPIRMGRNTMKIYTAILAGCDKGKQPSFRELMDLTGIAGAEGISGHIRKLKKLGLIATEFRSKRSITPLYRMEIHR